MGQHITAQLIAALGLGAVLALGACQTDREVTSPDPVPVTDKLVASGVLTTDDLPDGWGEVEPAPINTEVIADHPCDDKLKKLKPKESQSVAFEQGDLQLSNTIAYFPGGGGAQLENVLRDIAKDCKQVVLADQGLSIRTGSLKFGVLSDDTLALRFEFEPDVGPIQESDVILIRDGDMVSVVRLDGPRPSDKALLDTAVRTSIGRLGTIAQQI